MLQKTHQSRWLDKLHNNASKSRQLKKLSCLFSYNVSMEQLFGKTIVFTDQHFGVKSNSPLRQKIGAMAIKSILDAISNDS